MTKRTVVAFCLLLAVSGCATYAGGPMFTQAPAPPEKKSTLYIFHPKSVIIYTPLVKINGRPFVKLTQCGYSYAYLSPGIYQLNFHYGAGASGIISEIEVKPDQPLFVKYFSDGFGQYTREVPQTEALNEIKIYKYVEPFRIELDQ